MKKYITVLFNDETNKKINYIIGIVYMVMLFIVFPLLPELTGIGRYSIKTTYYLLVTAIIFSVFFIFNIKRIIKHKYKLIDIVLIIYAFLILLSTCFSEYTKEILIEYPPCRGEGVVTLFAYILTFYITYKTFNRNMAIEKFIKIVVCILCIFGIVQITFGRHRDILSILGYSKHMACATFINPNFFSSYISIFLPIYLVYYLLEDKVGNIGILCALFAALVSAMTLGGYITFLLVFVIVSVYALIIQKNRKKVAIKILLLIICFSSIFISLNIINDNAYYEEAIQIGKEKGKLAKNDDTFGNNRMAIWKMSAEIIKDYPALGVGPDSFGREVVKKFYGKEDYMFYDVIIDKAHSEYLQIAATTGIVSLIFYSTFIFIICISLIKKYVHYVKSKELFNPKCIFLVAMSASIFSYLFQASANISVTCVAPIFWCMLGIGYNIAKSKE